MRRSPAGAVRRRGCSTHESAHRLATSGAVRFHRMRVLDSGGLGSVVGPLGDAGRLFLLGAVCGAVPAVARSRLIVESGAAAALEEGHQGNRACATAPVPVTLAGRPEKNR